MPGPATARPDADPCTGLRLRLGLWQINFTHICTLTCTYMCTRVSLSVSVSVCVCLCVQSITFRYKVVVVIAIVLVDCTGKKRKRVRAPFESEYFSSNGDYPATLLPCCSGTPIPWLLWPLAGREHMKMPCYVCLILSGASGKGSSYLRVNRRRTMSSCSHVTHGWLEVKRVVWVFFLTPLTPRVCSCGTSKLGCPDDYCSSDHWTTIDN